jgi:hypothetical protein
MFGPRSTCPSSPIESMMAVTERDPVILCSLVVAGIAVPVTGTQVAVPDRDLCAC